MKTMQVEMPKEISEQASISKFFARELRAWDRLSDEALGNFEKSL